ncbi:uncharacterized protein Z519_11181 [Cladophialophora bantiana CBS 173.52]|uniref:DNA-directed RNA polymerase subunit n=1 Tax=Cladophialophora bantiana (strain ATCC 10958 / CBS 173.52 / CDC B-1940 / NIH 8579) TaxID=1442370 RepID=A0A0D2ED95_CLAB1|nr:uncharacterized protein Z519_11181 [Cladophialophora bantiana CBS 173.52]KIW88071.1 hypothetical protein Z519_11181 [Cladophialophora bantiana CBS 173.52]
MSVQAKNKHAPSSKPVQDTESLSPPKKRKRDTECIEISKKKKTQRTEDVRESPARVVKSTEKKDKKKKKQKSKDKEDAAAGTVREAEEAPAPQDIELADAGTAEEDKEPDIRTDTIENGFGAVDEEQDQLSLLESEDPSSFYSTRLSLYLSIPAVSLEASLSSVLAVHLAPLLLTYFTPAQGIVLGFSDPVLSAKPNAGINLPLLPPRNGEMEPQAEVLAETADEFGVCWIWLTATFLVFRPERGDELYGWTNVTSEGFVGLVSYNYFQTAIGKGRIPADWKWNGPSRERVQKNRKKGRKGRLRDEKGLDDGAEHSTQETATTVVETPSSQALLAEDGGYFADASGTKIKSTLKFRVANTEIVPAHDRHKWSLQIDGTLLDDEAERKVLEEERAKFEHAQESSHFKSPRGKDMAVMSGALRRSLSREGSVGLRISGHTPARHRVTY